jgi:cell division protein FtsL
MATRSATVRYASRSAVSGSNAYDLSRIREYAPEPERSPEKKPAERQPAKAEPKAVQKPVAMTAQRAQKSYGVSLFAITGFVVVAVMMVFVLLAHVRFNEVTSESVRLQARLDELGVQERKLKIDYENVFDVYAVEQYATNVLGMSKPSESQVGAVQSAVFDKAVIVSAENEETGESESMVTFLASLVSYFK